MAPRLILRISLSQAVTPRPGQLTLEAAVHRGPQTGGGPQQREKRPGHRRHLRSSPRIGAASEILHQPVRWCVFTRALTSAAPRTSPPGSSVHRIFQARILEWVAFPSPGDLSEPGIEPGAPAMSSALQVSSLLLSHQGSPSLSCINLTGGAQETSL